MGTFLLSIGDQMDKVFYAFDMKVFEFFGSIQSPLMTAVAKFFTFFGDGKFVILLMITGIGLCLFKKNTAVWYSFADFHHNRNTDYKCIS